MLHSFSVWLTGGNHPYCTLIECLSHDWLTIIWLTALRAAVIIQYAIIAVNFRKGAKKLEDSNAKRSLSDMVWIFILCLICGYVFQVGAIWWPAQRLLAGMLVLLNLFCVRYIMRGGLGNAVSEIAHATADRDDAKKLRTILDTLPIMAWTANPDGYLIWYNARWYEYTGTTLEEMKGWVWQSVHDPAELPNVLTEWKKCLASGAKFEMTFPLRRHDGVYRWFLTRCTPVFGSDGKNVGWFGVNCDVEHAHKNQTQARAALAELERLTLAMNEKNIGGV